MPGSNDSSPSRDYYEGQPHYDREAVRFFDIAHEGAQVRAIAEAAHQLEHLHGASPRSVVVVATDQIAEAAAHCAVELSQPLRWPVVVVKRLPNFIGPLDVVLVVGDVPDQETATADLVAAAGRGAETILAGPVDGPLVEDAPDSTVVLPSPPTSAGSSPLRTVAAVLAVLSSLTGYSGQLDGVADDVDEELRQLSPERDETVNAARQLRAFVHGARVLHTGYSREGAAVAQLVATLWSARGLPSGFVDRNELAAALDDESSAAANDIFYDPFLDGDGAAVPIKTIVWAERDPQLAGARSESAEGSQTSELTGALQLIVRGFAATAMEDF